jgi:predicted RNA binding protein YcfA (HicA-like mRNA interferase family)
MSSLPKLSANDIIKELVRKGFEVKRQSGSHIILTKENPAPKKTVVIPSYSEIAKGTLLSIIRQTGMTKEEFIEMFE